MRFDEISYSCAITGPRLGCFDDRARGDLDAGDREVQRAPRATAAQMQLSTHPGLGPAIACISQPGLALPDMRALRRSLVREHPVFERNGSASRADEFRSLERWRCGSGPGGLVSHAALAS